MSIGFGILLIVLGAFLRFAFTGNIPYVDDDVFGVILMLAGVVTVILGVIMTVQRSRTKHVQETRYRGPGQ